MSEGVQQSMSFHSTQPDLRAGLRYYQTEAVDACLAELREGRNTACVLATGLGKTQVACAVASEWKHGRVLFLAHRHELLDQMGKRLVQMSGGVIMEGYDIGYEQADRSSSPKNRFVVGSNASVWRDDRLERLEKEGGFGLIIIDEFHRAGDRSVTYTRILERFPNASVLGLSATPYRSDKASLDHVASEAAYRMDIKDGIDSGFLVPVKAEQIHIQEVNLDLVPTARGDLAPGALDREMLKGIFGIVHELNKRIPWGTRQGVVFVPGVQSAHFMADVMRQESGRDDIAIVVDGKTDHAVRAKLLRDFKAGKHQWFVNVGIATEGFDAPNVSVVANACPTKSKNKHVQQMGRGTRVLPGVIDDWKGEEDSSRRREAIAKSSKTHVTVYDFVGNCTRHTLVCPADILGEASDANPADIARAKEKLAKGEALDVSQAIEEAKEERLTEEEKRLKAVEDEMARAQERVELATRTRVRSVKAVSQEVDPGLVAKGMAKRKKGKALGAGPVFEYRRDMEALKKYGFSTKQVEQHGVSALLVAKKQRDRDGLCSVSALRQLKRFGISDPKVTRDGASRAMGYLAQSGWHPQRVNKAKLKQAVYGEAKESK